MQNIRDSHNNDECLSKSDYLVHVPEHIVEKRIEQVTTRNVEQSQQK